MKKFQLKPSVKKIHLLVILACIIFGFGCQKSIEGIQTEIPNVSASRMAAGNKQVHFPSQDPGIPFYARVTPLLNQFFVADGWLVIPFYRDPSCIRADYNFLDTYDVPAAFGCASSIKGFYMIEKDAPLGTFPKIAHSTGSSVPFWFIRWSDFQATMIDGVVTISELQSLNPLIGTASRFNEILQPGYEKHFVQINASGVLTDGRTFDFHVTHVHDETKSINLTIK